MGDDDQVPTSLVALRNVAAVAGRDVQFPGPTEAVAAQARKLG
ncbi:hypothetical protein ABZ154_11015 [Streptomyces sp. NPDC006261]